MTDAELNAEVARRLGLKVEGPPLGFSEEVVRFPNGTWDFIPKYATDLNEAVKLPGYFVIESLIPSGWLVSCRKDGKDHWIMHEVLSKAVCLAFLAADDAKGVGDGS
jgi:hypothetical protein